MQVYSNYDTESRPGWTKIQEMYEIYIPFLKERRGYIVTSLPSLFIGQRDACLFLHEVPDLPRKVLGMASSEECSDGTIIIDGSIMEGVM